MREKSLPESVLCTRPIIFIALKCSLLIYFFKELCLSVSTGKQISTLLEEENEVTVKPMLHKEPRDGGYLWFLECQYFLSLSVVF